MTRRAWILRFLVADALQKVLVRFIRWKNKARKRISVRPLRYRSLLHWHRYHTTSKRLTWPVGTPFWRWKEKP